MEKESEKYLRVKKRIKEEKGFYSHLVTYLIINITLQLFYSGVFGAFLSSGHMPWWARYTTPLFWGLSLFIHWLYVFKGIRSIKFFKKWEERKIKQFIEEEELSMRFRESKKSNTIS